MVTSVNDIRLGTGKSLTFFYSVGYTYLNSVNIQRKVLEGVFLLLLLQDRTDSQHTVECTPCSLAINMSHKMFSSIHYKHTAKTFLPFRIVIG